MHGLHPISKLQYVIFIFVLRAGWVWQAWRHSRFVPKNWFQEGLYRGCMFSNIMNKGCVGNPVDPIPMNLSTVMFHFCQISVATFEPNIRLRLKCCWLYFLNFQHYAQNFQHFTKEFRALVSDHNSRKCVPEYYLSNRFSQHRYNVLLTYWKAYYTLTEIIPKS